MAYAGWTAVIQDDRGNIQPGATVEVRNITTGSLAVLYADRMGTVGLGNPFQADPEGYATFYARGSEYRITATRGPWTTEWPYVPVGTTQGVDLADLALGLDYDAQVNTLPERDAYDGEPEGFSVLVSDVGDGRGAVYTRTDVPGEWSDPAFITGTPGPATNISIGTVDTVDYGEGSSATMTGSSPAQVLNLELERGAPGRIENFQGPWSGSVAYASGDIVESGGSLYMAMVADPAAAPPSTGWELFLPGSSVADGAVTIAKTDGTFARITFDTVAQLMTGVVAGKTLGYDTGLIVSPGDIIEAQGFRYEVAASDATDAHVETAGGVKLKPLPYLPGHISVIQFNVTHNEATAANQAAMEAAAVYCRAEGYRLTSPSWLTIQLTAMVDLRGIGLGIEGRVVGAGLVPVLTLGGYNSVRNSPKQYVFEVANGLGADHTQPAVQVRGMMGSAIHMQRCLSMEWIADTHSSRGGEDDHIAYNSFYVDDIGVLKITDNPDTDGDPVQWINENAFYCKRVGRLLIHGNTYGHNHNIFYTPNIETSIDDTIPEIEIIKGTNNIILDARLEGVPYVRFAGGARDNVVMYSWDENLEAVRTPERIYRQDRVEHDYTTGEWGANYVYRRQDKLVTKHRLLEFSTWANAVLSFNANAYDGMSDIERLQVHVAGLDTVARSSGGTIFHPLKYIPFGPQSRLLIKCDATTIRVRVRFYDASRNLITSAPAAFYSSGAGGWDDANDYYLTPNANYDNFGLISLDPNVAYISLEILGGGAVAPFRSLSAYIYTHLPEFVNSMSRYDMSRKMGMLVSPVANHPNRGVPYLGQMVALATGGYAQCTRRGSFTSGFIASGNDSVLLPSGHGVQVGDSIGIELSADTAHWSTVTESYSTNVIIATPVPSAVSVGSRIETQRWTTA